MDPLVTVTIFFGIAYLSSGILTVYTLAYTRKKTAVLIIAGNIIQAFLAFRIFPGGTAYILFYFLTAWMIANFAVLFFPPETRRLFLK